ncbi:MAG: CarD family transcriptional regulator [Alphaproteobacteria bacterium]|nr:MAG: CarD family transcriptional regulator [Alphaproteobacteria bacterium]
MNEIATDRFERRTGITPADYDLLLRLPLFSGLSRPVVESLLADAWVQRFPRNRILFLEDEEATRFYAIFDGWVKLFRQTEEGQESIIAVLSRAETFAEAAMFDQGVFPVSAMTVDDSRLLVVPAESFMRRIGQHPDYLFNILASMSRHLRRLVSQVEHLTVRSTTERLAIFLLHLCDRTGGSAVVRLPLDKALIAGRLGMQPETLSRSLAKLRGVGVETRGSELQIKDVAALRALAAGRRR